MFDPGFGTKQIKGLHAFGVQALCFLFRKKMGCSAILDWRPSGVLPGQRPVLQRLSDRPDCT